MGSRIRVASDERGFSLMEALVSIMILGTGLLALGQAFALGMLHMSTSSGNLIAREKAREAVESVHTARDTRTITWAQIYNEADGGVFLDGAQSLNQPGADGLVNTADDGTVETVIDPGPDGQLGTTDDAAIELSNYTREIQILELTPANADLREIRVTIRYTVGDAQRQYVLRTYISSFS